MQTLKNHSVHFFSSRNIFYGFCSALSKLQLKKSGPKRFIKAHTAP